MAEPFKHRPAHLQLLAISWNFGWPVAAGVALGHWLDEALGTSPAATLFLGIGSMAGAAWRLIQLGRRDAAEWREREKGDDT
ncbi:MAG: AtpZ/AtpI family protein [Candidatus Binatia bacterium]